tara:strand:+ start:631 stop:774 length:144 start_codon:yes stop_codon:yes gene_type:complete
MGFTGFSDKEKNPRKSAELCGLFSVKVAKTLGFYWWAVQGSNLRPAD